MKIFKNRGDIYLSKSRTGADREQHILLGILVSRAPGVCGGCALCRGQK